jgi:hypothetical protein
LLPFYSERIIKQQAGFFTKYGVPSKLFMKKTPEPVSVAAKSLFATFLDKMFMLVVFPSLK